MQVAVQGREAGCLGSPPREGFGPLRIGIWPPGGPRALSGHGGKVLRSGT